MEKRTWCKPWRRWLQACLCGRRQAWVTHGCSSGPPQLLSLEDERSTAVLHILWSAWVSAHQTVVSDICQCGEEEEEPKQHRVTSGSEVVAWVKEEELGCTLDIIDGHEYGCANKQTESVSYVTCHMPTNRKKVPKKERSQGV